MTTRIGVAITTHNRGSIIQKTVDHWREMLPKGAVLVLVDDSSDTPVHVQGVDELYRFESNVGIPRAKNKCLDLLINKHNCDELFLSDDDCWPVSDNWWIPYVESSEPHLSYQFLDVQGPKKLNDLKLIHSDDYHCAYTDQRGCMLYYNRAAIETAGGFDPIFGKGMYEHGELANRIHSLGLTTWRYADVANSSELWHSEDEINPEAHKRSVDGAERGALVRRNVSIFQERRASGYKKFVPYVEPSSGSGSLITCYLTSQIDPQRGTKWDPTRIKDDLTVWAESAWKTSPNADRIVIADEGKFSKRDLFGAHLHTVQNTEINVYHQRWLHIYQYLRDNPQDGWIWCTDGTDVETLRDPFVDLIPGRLYVGYENKQVGDPWMRKFHPTRRLQLFIHANRGNQLLNAGVVGGDYFTMFEFSHRMISAYYDLESERFWSKDRSKPDIGDMALFNLVVYEHFKNRFITGPAIVTDFKKNNDNGMALFRHK